MKIYIVVPAYNEGKRIGKVLKELQSQRLPVIVVDDGSKDNTFKEVLKSKYLALRHRINLGKGAAMKTGAMAAFELGADAVIFMDSDGQHKVEDLPNFIKTLNKKTDIVFGSRNLGLKMPFVRFAGNKVASVFVNILFGIYVSDLVCGFRAITKKAFAKIMWESTGYGVETEMVIRTAKSGLIHCEVPVKTVYYDQYKGVSIMDAFDILFSVLRWRIKL